MKIALFGTSADPPTKGHQAILAWLSVHYDQVAVWASDNPFKEHSTSLEHRMEMLSLLIEDLDLPKHNVAVYAQLSDRRSLYTVQKAQQIWQNQPEFTLVIGSDLVEQISKWYHAEELLSQVELLIIPRPGYPINQTQLQQLETIATKGITYIANFKPPAVSSTAYRHQKQEHIVTPPIAEYINQKQLYA